MTATHHKDIEVIACGARYTVHFEGHAGAPRNEEYTLAGITLEEVLNPRERKRWLKHFGTEENIEREAIDIAMQRRRRTRE